MADNPKPPGRIASRKENKALKNKNECTGEDGLGPSNKATKKNNRKSLGGEIGKIGATRTTNRVAKTFYNKRRYRRGKDNSYGGLLKGKGEGGGDNQAQSEEGEGKRGGKSTRPELKSFF